MGLRKWNSFTPSLPTTGHDSVGGGYFLFYEGVGTVIDPGFNFLANFHQAGGLLTHIHNVVITHAHNDHTNDLETLLSLFYKRQDELKKDRIDAEKKGIKCLDVDHNVTLYLNLGTFKKYSGFLNLHANYIEDIRVIHAGEQYDLSEGLKLRVLQAFHDEVLSERYSVGLHFELAMKDRTFKNVVFTGDTGLCPTKVGEEGKPVLCINKEIWKYYFPAEKKKQDTDPTQYRIPPIDLLVAHLGSIKDQELDDAKLTLLNASISQNKEEVLVNESNLYGNHLGLLGTVKVLTELTPKLALVSEFGEELKKFLPRLMEVIRESVEESLPGVSPMPAVAPCALFLLYDLANHKIFSIISKKFEDADTIKFKPIWPYNDSGGKRKNFPSPYQEFKDNFMFFSKNQENNLNQFLDGIDCLMENMKTGEGLFADELKPAPEGTS